MGGRLTATVAVVLVAGGCFTEMSFPARPGDIHRLPSADAGAFAALSPRPWLARMHHRLEALLPASRQRALLTDDLVDIHSRPVDVLAHFGLRREALETLLGNSDGLSHTAQATGSDFSPDAPPAAWPGFEQVWIPINDSLSLAALLGRAKATSADADADAIVILPGLFGHNDILRTRDLAFALIEAGFHALAIEPRGHGQTDRRYPDVFYNFGTLEVGDLMIVSEWLQKRPDVRRTGLVGFCWGANLALLAAWFDGRPEKHRSISDGLAPHVLPPSGQPHFEAGVIAFSPTLRFEEILEEVARPRSPWERPVLATLQETVRRRMVLKKHGSHPACPRDGYDGSLRKLIDCEFARSALNYPGCVDDALAFLRILPHRDLPDGNKLACARVPTLIVQAANDPLAGAQDVADLVARTPNPNVAAVILPGGGHVGFAAYARAYHYSLIVNYFDPTRGPRALAPAEPATWPGTR